MGKWSCTLLGKALRRLTVDTHHTVEWRQFTLDPNSFRELVLYITQQSIDDPRFGATKLNKLLYYIDTRSFLELGQPITGAEYRRLPAGPVPPAILNAKKELVDAGAARIERRPYFNYYQERLVPLRDADVSLFSSNELKIVDEIIEQLWEYNGTELSNISHNEWGWQLAGNYEVIPYELAWMSPEPVPIEAIEHGLRLASKHSLMNE